ncbi:MAG: THUMP domain-containing protein [Porphyromonadaceae bacterium]|nr:THUMP domain-containing protein [Porphyromonadaceae bacterium]
MTSTTSTFIAKTFQGLEEVLAVEIEALGGKDIEIGHRMVSFTGDKELLYKTNLHCRTALRILKQIHTFTAKDTDELYEQVKKIDWTNYLTPSMTFAIDPVVFSDEFRHSKFVAYRAKDAIADFFNERFGERPSVRLNNTDILINLHINQTTCILSLDSSGESLHHRGYRIAQNETPLNEVLAAGLLLLAGWDGSRDLIDPMCGSGTFLIEAALIATGTPAGIYRKDFSFKHWNDFDAELFERLYNDESCEHPFEHKIYGSDISPVAIEIAQENIKNAGMSRYINLAVKPMQQYTEGEITPGGLLITDPPYGKRITTDDFMGLYSMIGTQLKHVFKGFDAWILSYNDECFDHIGLKAATRIPIMNGPLECSFRKYEIFDGKYNDFKRETGGFKREEASEKEFDRKKFPRAGWKQEGPRFPKERRERGPRPFDDRKRPLRDENFRTERREKPQYRDGEERDFERNGNSYQRNYRDNGFRSQFSDRFHDKREEPYEKKFTAEYDYDEEIKISRFRRERPHGDEAIRSYVRGRKPSIGNPDKKTGTEEDHFSKIFKKK